MIEKEQRYRRKKADIKMQFEINDYNGNRVKLGDKIVVIFPTRDVKTSLGDVFLAGKKVTGYLSFRISQGLGVKLISWKYIDGLTGYDKDRDMQRDVSEWFILRPFRYQFFKCDE